MEFEELHEAALENGLQLKMVVCDSVGHELETFDDADECNDYIKSHGTFEVDEDGELTYGEDEDDD